MARKFQIGEYPPTDQERVILRALKARSDSGWTLDDLLSELSKGRAEPMTYGALSVHITHLRRKGFPIRRYTIFSIRGGEIGPSARVRSKTAATEKRDAARSHDDTRAEPTHDRRIEAKCFRDVAAILLNLAHEARSGDLRHECLKLADFYKDSARDLERGARPARRQLARHADGVGNSPASLREPALS